MSKEDKLAGFKEKTSVFFEKIGALSKIQRLMICLVTFAVIGGGYYWFIFKQKQETLSRAKHEYETRTKQLLNFKKKAAQLAKYQKQMAMAREQFNQAMNELPDKRELPSLLEQISAAGARAGLTFYLFKPGKETSEEYYKRLPVSITVQGRYHQLTDFFHQILRINRIVNINNLNVKKKGRKLEMSCQAVTYMFVEKKENKNKKKRRKK